MCIGCAGLRLGIRHFHFPGLMSTIGVRPVQRCSQVCNSACWAGVVTKRKTFMLIGCDFVLEEPNWSGHGNELMSKMRAAGKCAVQALSNCAKMVLP